jgi:hypothetical protein
MTQDDNHTTNPAEMERRARALDRILDASFIASRLTDFSDRLAELARDLKGKTSALNAHIAALMVEIGDPTDDGEGER